MVVLVPRFLQFTLEEFDFLVLLGVTDLRSRLFSSEGVELLPQLSTGETPLSGSNSFGKILIGRISLKLFVLFVVRCFGFLIVQPVKLRLVTLPRPPRDVVIPERPQGQDHQQDTPQHKDTAVGFFFFALVYASDRHPRLSSCFVFKRPAQEKDPDADQR